MTRDPATSSDAPAPPAGPQTPASPPESPTPDAEGASIPRADDAPAREIGGPKGPDPTRYRDWERGGRCIDF